MSTFELKLKSRRSLFSHPRHLVLPIQLCTRSKENPHHPQVQNSVSSSLVMTYTANEILSYSKSQLGSVLMIKSAVFWIVFFNPLTHSSPQISPDFCSTLSDCHACVSSTVVTQLKASGLNTWIISTDYTSVSQKKLVQCQCLSVNVLVRVYLLQPTGKPHTLQREENWRWAESQNCPLFIAEQWEESKMIRIWLLLSFISLVLG